MAEVNSILKEAVKLYNRKMRDEAVDMFDKVLETDPVNPEANYYLGLIYSQEKRYEKAVVYLKAIADMGINLIFTQQCRMILGYIYFIGGEYERAENEYLTVLKNNFKITQVYAALSAVYYKLEKYDKALDFASKAYNKDTFNLNAKNTYGFLLCDLEIDAERGVELLRDVVRLKPDNAAYLDSLGWGYFKKGDVKASIASFKEALKYSGNPEIKEHFNIVMGIKKVPMRSFV